MQLSDILEESDFKIISQKTNISKENIEMLMDDDFVHLTKAKALGFISILERDYQVDLKTQREKALAYYKEHGNDEERMVFTVPGADENTGKERGNSTFMILLIVGLLAYSLWYFMSKYDEKALSTLIPFIENNTEEGSDKDLSIMQVIKEKLSIDSDEENR
jgi:hypothetical protein